jgi:hypothetical protein
MIAAKKIGARALAVAMAILMLFLNTPPPARGQDYRDQDDDDIDQIVARISYVQGAVSYGRGDDPDDWDPALVNVPFALGDRIYSSTEGRAELQLPGGNFVRIGRRSYLSALTLTYDTKQFYLGNGAATVNIRRLDPDEIFEIDTPNVAVTLETAGQYRVEVDEDGNTRVIVRRGTATVAADGRQVTVERAEMRIYGTEDRLQYETVGLGPIDAFDRWVDERQGRFERAYSSAYQYADEEIVGVEDLDQYGRWEDIPEYGRAWTPTQVAVGWQPFTVGRYFWQDPWGWSWISDEPWGWAPCHYGRWTYYRSRWYWVPVRRGVRVVRYAPAVVQFVYVRGHVGWFPLHPRDRFVPWWGRGRRVEDVTFVNRSRVVVVDQETFVSARRVQTRIVRDTTIIREVTRVRVTDSLPIPRRESIRVETERKIRVERPPANILSRPAVVRTAPLPPPPRFDEKLRVIRERQGKPLPPEEMVALGAKELKSRGVRIRPAAEGKGQFAPRGQNAPPPQPVTPPKGRKLATPDAPVLTDLPNRQKRQQERQQRFDQQKDQPRDEQQQKKQEKQSQEQLRKDQERQKDQERDRQKEEKRLQKDQIEQQRKDQQDDRRELERKQQEQDRLQKQQERERQKDPKQLQEEKRKEQEQDRRELERKQQEVERQKKQQEQDRQKQEKQIEEQKRKEQERERQKQQQDEQRKQQLRDQQKRDDQQREQERQRLQDERQRQREVDEQQRKGQQLRQQQERDEQKRLQDDQRKQQQIQKQQELERRRQEQERLRQEKQQQEQQRKEDGQDGRESERQRQIQEEKARQKQDQRKRQQQQQEEQRRKEQDEQPPPPPPPPPPPR